ncbi:alpha/beta fold hydrolase [Candidatus Dojkabacteria bacterium]|uniref:Alpha/beta fold hydrolase n=1 Tax=Candidatus Dojkabacteria bacterium TaxID=2099670 RepID=A0A3M0YZV5_9BACT|nr:MAG: alpha/beta fold hydrolase [Candidatus Dojkabacteria bacterium]
MRETLIILHGWNQSKKDWEEVINRLNEKDIDTVAFDLPGFGSQALISLDWGIPEYSQWVSQQIESSHKKKVILLGHSFGGRIASYLASQNPKWLHKLILYASPSIYRPSYQVRFKIFLAKLFKILGIKKKPNNKELEEADNREMGKIFRKVVPFDQTLNLSNIRVQTYLIWGERDDVVPLKIAKEMKQLISRSNLIVFKNLGHNAHKENVNLFVGKLIKLIKDV